MNTFMLHTSCINKCKALYNFIHLPSGKKNGLDQMMSLIWRERKKMIHWSAAVWTDFPRFTVTTTQSSRLHYAPSDLIFAQFFLMKSVAVFNPKSDLHKPKQGFVFSFFVFFMRHIGKHME